MNTLKQRIIKNNNNLIITRTPLRISFFGGGTDIPYFYFREYGQTISQAINKYVYVIIKSHNNYDEKYRINYSKTENVNYLDKMKNKRVKAILKYFKFNKPLYISTISDIPANTGLGSSSAFTVGLIKAVSILLKKKISKKQIAELAFKIENKSLKEDLGKQDHYIAAFGGLKHIIYKKKNIKMKNINRIKENINYLIRNSLLIFTNQKRESKTILSSQKKNFKRNFNNLIKIKENVNKFTLLLLKKNSLKNIGFLLDKSWKLKMQLSNKISNNKIDLIYKKLINEGCYGGKLLGAGNGGFLFMVMSPNIKNKILRKFNKYKIFQPDSDNYGTTIIKY